MRTKRSLVQRRKHAGILHSSIKLFFFKNYWPLDNAVSRHNPFTSFLKTVTYSLESCFSDRCNRWILASHLPRRCLLPETMKDTQMKVVSSGRPSHAKQTICFKPRQTGNWSISKRISRRRKTWRTFWIRMGQALYTTQRRWTAFRSSTSWLKQALVSMFTAKMAWHRFMLLPGKYEKNSLRCLSCNVSKNGV